MKTLMISSLAVFLVGPATAAVLFFEASLDGAQSGTGSPGIGSVTMSIDDASGVWSLSGSYSGLNGTVTVSHIHGPAAPGSTAGVVKGLSNTAGTSGTLSGSDTATGVYSGAQIADLVAGLHYVNVHSNTNPGGEIRGQLTQVPEPSLAALSALGLAMFLRRRR